VQMRAARPSCVVIRCYPCVHRNPPYKKSKGKA
jgi:hypothetical protein